MQSKDALAQRRRSSGMIPFWIKDHSSSGSIADHRTVTASSSHQHAWRYHLILINRLNYIANMLFSSNYQLSIASKMWTTKISRHM